MTFYGSGCIYCYDEDHPEGSKPGFNESDVPNFQGSFYAKTKTMVQELAAAYPNVLMLRIRLPITGDLINCRRNLVTKILGYDRVVNIQNSLTVLPEMLPYSIKMVTPSFILLLILNYGFSRRKRKPLVFSILQILEVSVTIKYCF